MWISKRGYRRNGQTLPAGVPVPEVEKADSYVRDRLVTLGMIEQVMTVEKPTVPAVHKLEKASAVEPFAAIVQKLEKEEVAQTVAAVAPKQEQLPIRGRPPIINR